MKNNIFSVIRDTKENLCGNGYFFPKDEHCLGTQMSSLKTGDYCINGCTHLIVERKASAAEFAGNVTEDRFALEIERMTKFELPFLVLEFDWDKVINFPEGSGLSEKQKKSIKVTGKFLQKMIIKYQLLGINVCLLGTEFKAQNYVYQLFKNHAYTCCEKKDS